MNYDNVYDGFVDNEKKKRGRKQKKTTNEGEEVNERKISALMMWYLPMIDRLKRLFYSARDAKLMIWHVCARWV
jgi:hypothetical protein